MVGGVHPIPGSGHVPGSKIIGAVVGTGALVAAVFMYRSARAFEPHTLSKNWKDATIDYTSEMVFEGAPDQRIHMNPFYHGIPAEHVLKSA